MNINLDQYLRLETGNIGNLGGSTVGSEVLYNNQQAYGFVLVLTGAE